MTQTQGGLGKGLASLIPSKVVQPSTSNPEETVGGEKILQISVESIAPNPMQPRQFFNDAEIEELMSSIKEYGILQPLIVTEKGDGTYELIAGERRLRSAKNLDFKTVPVIIRQAGELEKLELALIENIQRQDLNPIEKAEAYHRLMDEFALTQEEAAKRVGKTRSVVANALRLLTLPTEIQVAVANGRLSEGHAKVIAGLPSEEEQLKFFKQVVQHNMTVRQSESAAKKISVRTYTRRAKAEADPATAAREEELRQFFGTKVSIKKSGQGGHIEISYYSEEELDELIKKLSSA